MIVCVNFGIGQNIILRSQALHSRALLRRISHYAAFGPSRSEKLRHLLRYVNQTSEGSQSCDHWGKSKRCFPFLRGEIPAEMARNPRLSVLPVQTLPAAALRKYASCNNARLSARRDSVGHPQALSCAIGGSNVLTVVHNDRAVDSQPRGRTVPPQMQGRAASRAVAARGLQSMKRSKSWSSFKPFCATGPSVLRVPAYPGSRVRRGGKCNLIVLIGAAFLNVTGDKTCVFLSG